MTGKTRVCGIIANPVEHSMSPLMQNFYAEKTGTDLAYVPFRVLTEHLSEAVAGAHALNLQGLNVTVPHKQDVMRYLCDIHEDAKAIGAVNTLVRREDGFCGYNTDAAGLLRAMTEEGIAIKGRVCILLGAGGAAKAAAYVLAKEGAAKVYVLNRNRERAEAVAESINGLMGHPVLTALSLDGWRGIKERDCLAVQTTSVGMFPSEGISPVEEPAFFEKLHTAVDVIYTPMETEFMKLAGQAGVKTMNGLNMLLYQGIIAFELWNPGVKIGRDVICKARELLIGQLGDKRR